MSAEEGSKELTTEVTETEQKEEGKAFEQLEKFVVEKVESSLASFKEGIENSLTAKIGKEIETQLKNRAKIKEAARESEQDKLFKDVIALTKGSLWK